MSFHDDYNSFYRPSQNGHQEQPPVIDLTPSASQPEAGAPVSPQPKKRGRGRRVVAWALAGVLLLGGGFGAGYVLKDHLPGGEDSTSLYLSDRQAVEVSPMTVTGSQRMTYTELYASTVNSVVSINASATTNVFGQEATVMASSGSGFIINEDGYIVTNYHVINGSDTVRVTLYDGSTYDAEVIGGDSDYDLAVLKIDATGLQPAVMGNSTELQVGDDIAVIGNPLGELTFSMSEGIVSTTNRLINVDGTPFNMIQITAAVNAGNSGGPLFNMYGEVVGIVSAKYSGSGSDTSVEGLGFAIPISDAIPMVQDIITNGYITTKPYLGITAATLQRGWVSNSDLTEGVYIYSVEEGGAADQAGLQAGDVIVQIGNTDISDMDDITALKKEYAAGDTVTVTYYRDSQQLTTQLTFGSEPQSTQTAADSSQSTAPSYNYNTDPWSYYFGNRNGGYYGSAA